MTTPTNDTTTADAMLDAHRRRIAAMPTTITIPVTPRRDRNAARPTPRPRRRRTL